MPHLGRRSLLAAFAALAAGACASATAQTPRSEDDAFLDGLVGEWTLEGQVQGEPVRNTARGARVLQAWLEFHLIDAADPPAYEAAVFIAADGNGDYVAHWLDTFGAAGARVAGAGRRTGEVADAHRPIRRRPLPQHLDAPSRRRSAFAHRSATGGPILADLRLLHDRPCAVT